MLLFIVPAHMLGMPLYADAERVGRKLYPFCKTVFAYGGNGKTGTGSVYGLMMKAVDNGGIFPENFFQSGIGIEADLMAAFVFGEKVGMSAGLQAPDILVKSAAKENV